MCAGNSYILFLLLKLISQCPVICFKNHSALSAIVFTHIDPPDDDVHSEYFYGKCTPQDKTLIAHQQWKHEELVGRLIVRSWLNVVTLPNCVYIRSKSNYGDLVRYHAYKFNICICTLVYNYGGEKFTYHYYEWYTPVELMRNIHWDIFFYIAH